MRTAHSTVSSFGRGVFPLALLVLVVAFFSCDYPGGEVAGNTLPTTELANVPPNDTIALYYRLGAIPEFTLYWRGGDPDGYVVAFRYLWRNRRADGSEEESPTRTLLNITSVGGVTLPRVIGVAGRPQSLFRIYNEIVTLNREDPNDTAAIRIIRDSIETERPFAFPYSTGPVAGDSIYGMDPLTNPTPTKGVFIFNSPDSANRQTFRIWSVDNSDAADPTSANVTFWTQRSPQPIVTITGGPDNSTNAWAIRYVTERWTGLQFTFGFQDPSTFEQQFSWSVDDTLHWSGWSSDPRALVTALNFQSTTSQHVIYARCRNRWGSISRTVSRQFTATVPNFDNPAYPRRTLIINNNVKLPASPVLTPDTNQVKAFYRELMDSLGLAGNYDIWSTQSASGAFPSRTVMGNYSSVILLSEHRLSNLGLAGLRYIVENGTKQPLLENYLQVGGKMIYSTAPDVDRVWSEYSRWSERIWHTQPLRTPAPGGSAERDFVGAAGRLGYPSVTLDPAKIHPDSTATPGGPRALRLIMLHPPRGFGESIFLYTSGTGQAGFANGPLGVRYLAPPPLPPARSTYSVVCLGFPLYYMEKSGAIAVLRKAFTDINE